MGVTISSGVTARDPLGHIGVRSGTIYYMSPVVSPAASANAVAANILYCQPIILNGTVTRMGIEVTAGSAGLCRLGLYTNANGAPGTLLLDAGTVDTTNIALVETTIAYTMPVDWVWMVGVFNATPTTRCGSATTSSILGSATTSAGTRGLTAAFNYAVLPAVAPAVTAFSTATPAFWLRAA